ncbi:response regulator transcription factor [Pedobacter sp. MC2016-15]|uniref:response regulator n=1 Tax=Pedobacter sp. MC2016-15 TaxID=2994473 RepID=UPI002247E8F1|nr:response regulator transcription factor [Pedobacter sp. MC2016-15]MCX2481061.1 response regulator transcription factor [Pedobacter sp. MC2016-15]
MSVAQAKIVIVDDHPLIIQGLTAMLQEHSQFVITASFTRGLEFMSYLREHAVDVVILDISLPDCNGMDICKEIKALAPQTRVIALTNHNERSLIMQMLQNGANGYLLKNASSEELLAGILQVLNGQLSFSKAIEEIITQPTVYERDPLPKLTRRELEVLKLIAAGETSLVIADQLCVSPLTIETHRRNLLQKFRVRNVAELIKISYQLGLLA